MTTSCGPARAVVIENRHPSVGSSTPTIGTSHLPRNQKIFSGLFQFNCIQYWLKKIYFHKGQNTFLIITLCNFRSFCLILNHFVFLEHLFNFGIISLFGWYGGGNSTFAEEVLQISASLP